MAFDEYEVRMRPMTSDEVFVALVVFARASNGVEPLLGESLPVADATRDSPAKCVAVEFGNGLWADAGNGLNELFGTSIAREQWRAAFKPARSRTIGAICDLIAQHAKVPVIEPVIVFGDRSLAAGAFLVVRRIFADAGADVSNFRPSSPLTPYLRDKCGNVLPHLMRVAPGRIPTPAVDAPVHDAFTWGLFVSCGILVLGKWLRVPPMAMMMAGVSTILFCIMLWACNRAVKPRDIRLGDARTFRDLARMITGERSAFCGFPMVVPGTGLA
ncbi:MAG TPA: hypothetical protein VGR35_03660 [Tepidisphaeraceae bacterium]|nr:hypothetical protein [Tepidisphaeraceae bacterium]